MAYQIQKLARGMRSQNFLHCLPIWDIHSAYLLELDCTGLRVAWGRGLSLYLSMSLSLFISLYTSREVLRCPYPERDSHTTSIREYKKVIRCRFLRPSSITPESESLVNGSILAS